MEKEEKKKIKSRAWSFIMYPDSAPEGWREELISYGIQTCISPLHDKDFKDDGTPKKPHYHIILQFPGPAYSKQVRDICESMNGFMEVRDEKARVYDIRRATRYQAHMDEKNKYHYNPGEIMAYNGFDLAIMYKVSQAEKYELIADMIDYCDEHRIFYFSQLLRYARRFKPDTWYAIISPGL